MTASHDIELITVLGDETLARAAAAALDPPLTGVRWTTSSSPSLEAIPPAVPSSGLRIALVDFAEVGTERAGGAIPDPPLVVLGRNASPEFKAEALLTGAVDFLDGIPPSPEFQARLLRHALISAGSLA